jgi:DNA-binding SARP family transcriptional activator
MDHRSDSAVTIGIRTIRTRHAAERPVEISLLPTFRARVGDDILAIPYRAQRVLAFLAISGGRARRAVVAGRLWPDGSEERASASLRTALWSMPRRPPIVLIDGPSLVLAPAVAVDYEAAGAHIEAILDGRPEVAPRSAVDALLDADLLADWSEEWLVVEQERYRQLRLHALEAQCERLARAGLTVRAIQAGMAAVAAEPLRESAHRALIRAYAVEGNRSEVVRQSRMYERLLREELDLEPSPEFQALLSSLLRPVATALERRDAPVTVG